MHRLLVTLCSAVLFAAVLPRIAFSEGIPPVGTWKLNVTKSTFNGPPPRSQIVAVQAEGQGLRLTIENVDAEGNTAKAVIINFGDGKFHPVRGPLYDAQADKVVNDSTAWIIRTEAGKVVQTLISEVSADGKAWTVTTAGVTPDGQQINNVLVREKQ
jgi:hypothetical protein